MRLRALSIFSGIVIFLLLCAGVIFFASGNKHQEKNSVTEEKQKETSDMRLTDESKIEMVLNGFADTIFNYDTRERRYFEGADAYMTKNGYEKFKPLVIEEEGDQIPDPLPVISKLQSMKLYYSEISNNKVEVVMEADISFSAAESNSILEYLKFTVEKHNEEWLISDCNVFATIQN